jgi:hypothetical protein
MKGEILVATDGRAAADGASVLLVRVQTDEDVPAPPRSCHRRPSEVR